MSEQHRVRRIGEIKAKRRQLAEQIEDARDRGLPARALDLTCIAHKLWQEQVALEMR